MTDLLQRVEQNIQNRRLRQRGQAILVAVSGGLNSMVLLHALHELSSRQRWQLTVAHFNHRLRGLSSDADEKTGPSNRRYDEAGLRRRTGKREEICEKIKIVRRNGRAKIAA